MKEGSTGWESGTIAPAPSVHNHELPEIVMNTFICQKILVVVLFFLTALNLAPFSVGGVQQFSNFS